MMRSFGKGFSTGVVLTVVIMTFAVPSNFCNPPNTFDVQQHHSVQLKMMTSYGQNNSVVDDLPFELGQHCVVHIHGIHHSGTGYLRETVYESLGGANTCSKHKNTGKVENEGQHLQTVYPKYVKRNNTCRSEGVDKKRFGSRRYYCPEILPIAQEAGSKEKLYKEWSQHWDMSKFFLIQKTPTLDVLFLERMKLETTAHIVVLRHPMAFQVFNPIWGMIKFLDMWSNVLEHLSLNDIELYAMVNYEALVLYRDDIMMELSRFIKRGCGYKDRLQNTHRRLHLHNNQNATKYLSIPDQRLYPWDKCKQNKMRNCRTMMDELEPIMRELGYTWDFEASYILRKENDTKLLFSSDSPPSMALVQKMKDLASKWGIGDTSL